MYIISLNSEEKKNYIALFINYDDEHDIDSVEYSFIIDSDFTKPLFFKSDASFGYNQTQKSFIQKFMDELKENLIKYNIFDKLLILAGIRQDVSNLTRIMKKGGYKIPNIFLNNVIELFGKDFDGVSDMKEAVEVFYTCYLLNEEVIKNKVKIINNM